MRWAGQPTRPSVTAAGIPQLGRFSGGRRLSIRLAWAALVASPGLCFFAPHPPPVHPPRPVPISTSKGLAGIPRGASASRDTTSQDETVLPVDHHVEREIINTLIPGANSGVPGPYRRKGPFRSNSASVLSQPRLATDNTVASQPSFVSSVRWLEPSNSFRSTMLLPIHHRRITLRRRPVLLQIFAFQLPCKRVLLQRPAPHCLGENLSFESLEGLHTGSCLEPPCASRKLAPSPIEGRDSHATYSLCSFVVDI